MELGVLGPLLVIDDGHTAVHVAAARQRILLAALLVRANRIVSVDELAEIVWDGEPPRSAVGTLRSYMMRLRHAVGSDLAARIVTRHPGYLCEVDTDELDTVRFETLCDSVSTAMRERQWARAADSAARALALWRGTPLLDVPSQRLRQELVPRLEQLRLQALEDRIEADLRLRQHDRLVPELRALVAGHPLRERFRAQLMLALARGGRQAEALAAYQDARRTLVDELGVEPGPELRGVHQQVLTADPALVDAGPVVAVPRQLPAPPGMFTGRRSELDRLSEAAAGGTTLVITAIGGTGGIGKTWLALHWAHEHLDQFPDGQLYVNLRGFDPTDQPVPPAVALRGFLDALGVEPASSPRVPAEQSALFRSLVADRRMLILADNALDAEQVIPLLPGSPTCTVLITSRHRLTGLATTHTADLLDLDVLPDGDAHQLLTRHLGAKRVSAEPDAVTELISLCAGLPLALGIVAARAAQHRDFPLAVLAKDLRDAATRLDALDAGRLHANLRSVLSWSYRALDEPAATLFALLGSAPGPDIGLAAAASLAGLPVGRARSVLRELENASLVQQHVPGRYRMHDLTRLYATEQTVDRAALRRLVDFYLHTALAADRLLNRFRDPIELDPPPAGCVPVPPSDVTAAWHWFEAEHACLLAAQQFADAEQWHTVVWQLAWTVNTFHERRGLGIDGLACWRTALAAATRLADPATLATVLERIGRAYMRSGRHAESLDHLRRALDIAERLDDHHQQATIHANLASPWEMLGEHRRALFHSERALRLYRELGDHVYVGVSLSAVAWSQARLGRYDEAVGTAAQALAMARRHSYRNLEAAVLDTLGYVANVTGRHTEALGYYRQALDGFRDIGSTHTEADIHACIGDTHAALGEPGEARVNWRRALDLYRTQHRTSDVDDVRRKLDA